MRHVLCEIFLIQAASCTSFFDALLHQLNNSAATAMATVSDKPSQSLCQAGHAAKYFAADLGFAQSRLGAIHWATDEHATTVTCDE